MVKYFPLDAGISFESVGSDLLSFDWQSRCADFAIPGDEEIVLRVAFRTDVIVRMLDEMALSTETDPATWEGMLPNHFAYRVEGDRFPEAQSDVWKDGHAQRLEHYRFITGWGCLDALSSVPPAFAVIPKWPHPAADGG